LKQHKVVVGRKRRRWLATKKFPGSNFSVWGRNVGPATASPAALKLVALSQKSIVTSRLRLGFVVLGDSNFCLELAVVDPLNLDIAQHRFHVRETSFSR
jgi:hypothetical protein